MEYYRKVITYFNENNSLIIALVVTVATYAFIISAKKITIKKLSSHLHPKKRILSDLSLALISKLSVLLKISLALFAGSLFLELSPKVLQLREKAIILIFLLQCAQWSNILIDFWINRVLKQNAFKDPNSATTVGLISFFARTFLLVLITLLALNNLGVNITALVAGLGVGGIAVALALQNILGDLFASLTIVLDKPFIVDDFIVVGDVLGRVEHIGLKTTRIRSLSGEQIIFSNNDLLGSRIRNFQRMSERRILQNFTVTYQTEVEKLRKIPHLIKEAIEERNSSTLRVRFERCHFLELQDSALRFELVYWVLSPDYGVYADIAQEINLSVVECFNKERIDFAYPTRTLYVTHPNNNNA